MIMIPQNELKKTFLEGKLDFCIVTVFKYENNRYFWLLGIFVSFIYKINFVIKDFFYFIPSWIGYSYKQKINLDTK